MQSIIDDNFGITYKSPKDLLEEYANMEQLTSISLKIYQPDLMVRLNDNYYKRNYNIFERYTVSIRDVRNDEIGTLTFFKSVKLSTYRELKQIPKNQLQYSKILKFSFCEVDEFSPVSGSIENIIENDYDIEHILLLYKVELDEECRGNRLLKYIISTLFDNVITKKSLIVLQAEPLNYSDDIEKSRNSLINYYKTVINNISLIDDTNFMYTIL